MCKQVGNSLEVGGRVTVLTFPVANITGTSLDGNSYIIVADH